MAKKPATESSVVQGRTESSNPSGKCLRPPLRLGAAFSHRPEVPRVPLVLPGFLIKPVGKGEKQAETRDSHLSDRNIPECQNRSFYPFCQKTVG